MADDTNHKLSGSGLSEVTAPADTDRLYLADNISTTPVSNYVEVGNLLGTARTAAEIAAGIVPTDIRPDPGNVLRYAGLAEAVSAAAAGGARGEGGGHVFIPQGYTETLSASITIDKNITIYSHNRDGVTITGPANLPIFVGTETDKVKQFILRGIRWVGGTGTSQLLLVPATNTWFEGQLIIENNRIEDFGDAAIECGTSVYMRTIRDNRFDNCTGCIKDNGNGSSAYIENNQFNDSEGTAPVVHLVGGDQFVLIKNAFIPGSGGITGPDILIDPTSSFGLGGRIYAFGNIFGAEGSTGGRTKVRVFNATTTNRSTDVTFISNKFHGAALSAGGVETAFKLENPIVNWDISKNEFDDIDIIVDDDFASAAGQFGSSVIKDNRFYQSSRQTLKLFVNGGRGFTRVDEPQMGSEWGITRAWEPFEVRNRLSFSSLLTSWDKAAGVTITGGQTDPYGGTDAALVARDASAAVQNILRAIDKTTGGNWATDNLICEFWAKAGTTNQIIVGLRNTTDSVWEGSLQYISLTANWKKYSINFNGLDNTKAYAFWAYITVVSATAIAGNFSFFAPHASEYPSDYVPTPSNVGVADTNIGRRFANTVQFVGGITLNVLSEVVTATNIITVDESGTTFYLDTAGGFTSTLPAPAIGLNYKFIVSTAPTTAYIITTNGGDNVLFGTFLDIVGELTYFSAQDTLNFVASTSPIGDFLEVESDGTNWYCVAKSGVDGGITVAAT